MRVSTVKEFKTHATEYLRSGEPLLITRRGKIAGFFVPVADPSQLPLDVRNQLLAALVERVREKIERKGSRKRRSVPSSRPLERLVVDANPFWSILACNCYQRS
jgi:antitoxin (DNA-binding transcriptional repressor) of toxin-antitoxin stability system